MTQAASPQYLIDKAGTFSTATIHEALGKKNALPSAIKPISQGMKLCGKAFTIQSMPGDNLLLHKAIAMASSGDILIADVAGFYEAGYWGEIMTVASQARGIAGLVINGCIRDADEIEALGFPVFSRGLSIRGTTKHGTGALNKSINIGDVQIAPDDVIVADRDGLVVVPKDRIEETIANCEARIEKEKRTMKALREGETTLEIYGWD